jgi:AcrR family transcriptional regulator
LHHQCNFLKLLEVPTAAAAVRSACATGRPALRNLSNGLSPAPAEVAPTDGRAIRGERTRRALAEAAIRLLEEGEENPTARRIAERAGVSLRLVFHHFDDVESVLNAAVSVQGERHWSKLRPLPSTLGLPARTRELVRQRTELYEAIAPVRRAASTLERSSPTISTELARARAALREQTRATFRQELGGLTSSRARRLVDAIETATSFEAWDGVTKTGRRPRDARLAMELLVDGALSASSPPRTKGAARQTATARRWPAARAQAPEKQTKRRSGA